MLKKIYHVTNYDSVHITTNAKSLMLLILAADLCCLSSEENALHSSSFSPLPKSTRLYIHQEEKHILAPPSKHRGRGT